MDFALVTLAPFTLIFPPIFFTLPSTSTLGCRIGVGGGTRHGGPSDNCTKRGLWGKLGKVPKVGNAINFSTSEVMLLSLLLLLLLLLNLLKPTKWLEKLGWCSQEFFFSKSCRNFEWTGLSADVTRICCVPCLSPPSDEKPEIYLKKNCLMPIAFLTYYTDINLGTKERIKWSDMYTLVYS